MEEFKVLYTYKNLGVGRGPCTARFWPWGGLCTTRIFYFRNPDYGHKKMLKKEFQYAFDAVERKPSLYFQMHAYEKLSTEWTRLQNTLFQTDCSNGSKKIVVCVCFAENTTFLTWKAVPAYETHIGTLARWKSTEDWYCVCWWDIREICFMSSNHL